MEVIEVSSTQNSSGNILPRSFTWRGEEYRVDSVGRRWRDEKGEHLLVMVEPRKRVFELFYDAQAAQWWLARRFDNRTAV